MFERKRNVEIPTDIPKRIKFGFVIRYSTRIAKRRENQVAESKSRSEIPEDSTRLHVTDCLLSYFLLKRWSGRRQGELVNWFSFRPEEFNSRNSRTIIRAEFLCHLTSPRCIVILFLFRRRSSPGKQIFLRLTRLKCFGGGKSPGTAVGTSHHLSGASHQPARPSLIALERLHLILFTNSLNNRLQPSPASRDLLWALTLYRRPADDSPSECGKSKSKWSFQPPHFSIPMNRDEKYVLNRLEKPLKPLVRSLRQPIGPKTLIARFVSFCLASPPVAGDYISICFLEISFFSSHHPENTDKSPACFKSLFNQHEIIQLRSFLLFHDAKSRGAKVFLFLSSP